MWRNGGAGDRRAAVVVYFTKYACVERTWGGKEGREEKRKEEKVEGRKSTKERKGRSKEKDKLKKKMIKES